MVWLKLVLVAILIGLSSYGYQHLASIHREEGRAEVQTKWDTAKKDELIQLAKENQLQAQMNEAKTKKVIQDYDKKYSDLETYYKDKLTQLHNAGGLRLDTREMCRGASLKAPGPSPGNAEGSGTVELPGGVEAGLLKLVERADKQRLQLSACQDWIEVNGFGPL